jgi:fucose permease
MQDRIGKRNMVNIGMAVTALGLFLPVMIYTFEFVLLGFALLGIGNTIVQVSANPLLVDVVPDNRRSSFLSFSQFFKSIGSMIAAPLAGWFALRFGDWKILFIVFGVVSVLAVLWLAATLVDETRNTEKRASFASSFKLLGNGFVAVMVICIFLVVGIDVGINAISGQFLKEKFASQIEVYESARSLYFFGKMLGTFAGAIMLARLSSPRFFIWTTLLGLMSLFALVFAPTELSAMVIIFIIGLTIANIFPLVFSLTLGRYPDRANEISGLMIMAVSGGAVLPPLMGWIADISSWTTSASVLIASAAFILFVALQKRKAV